MSGSSGWDILVLKGVAGKGQGNLSALEEFLWMFVAHDKGIVIVVVAVVVRGVSLLIVFVERIARALPIHPARFARLGFCNNN